MICETCGRSRMRIIDDETAECLHCGHRQDTDEIEACRYGALSDVPCVRCGQATVDTGYALECLGCGHVQHDIAAEPCTEGERIDAAFTRLADDRPGEYDE